MKKTSVLALVSLMTLLGGCATTTPPVQQPMGDQEPLLVGKPINQRISEASESINDQLFLLEKVRSGGHVGDYAVVEHNNRLDARIGSNRTIPRAYAHPKAPEVKVPEQVKEVKETAVSTEKVKRIEWKNNSLNTLAGNFAKALGYQLVLKEGAISDKNIDFSVENVTLMEAVNRLKQQVSPFAEIMVVEANKTVNVLYRK